MERLLNLLQDFYGENRKFSNENGLLTMTNGVENLSGAYAQTYITSKQGGFIKWLVENDKIDLGKIKKLYRKSNEHSIHTYPIMYEYSDYESLLMYLSIQDEPINFLISILK